MSTANRDKLEKSFALLGSDDIQKKRSYCLIMTVYNDFSFVKHNLKCFSKRFDVFIHIDRKARVPQSFFSELGTFENVFYTSKYKIKWGSIAHLEAVLHMLEQANRLGYERYLIISENTSSLYMLEDICNFFEENREKNFMELKTIEEAGKDRIDYYHFMSRYNSRDWSVLGKINTCFWTTIEKAMRKIGVRHHLRMEYPNKGYLYSALNDQAVDYLFSDEGRKRTGDMLKEMKYFYVGEEHFFQNVFNTRPEILKTIVNDSLVYDIWDRPEQGQPAFITEDDITRVLETKKLFFRKVGTKNQKIWGKLFSYRRMKD